MRNFIHHVSILLAAGAQASATGAVTGTTVDTTGFSGVAVVATLGTIAAGGTATLKALGGNVADGSDKVLLDGASVQANDTQDDKVLAVQIFKPEQRYITPVLERTGAGTAVVSLQVFLFNASHTPVDQPQVAASVALVTPKIAA